MNVCYETSAIVQNKTRVVYHKYSHNIHTYYLYNHAQNLKYENGEYLISTGPKYLKNCIGKCLSSHISRKERRGFFKNQLPA